jgi:hypothetical protein
MLCPLCVGKGFVPNEALDHFNKWDGAERRKGYRDTDNGALNFHEVVPAGRYTCCPRCDGGGKIFENLLSQSR